MRLPILLTCLISFFSNFLQAQEYNANNPPNTYQSKENPYYWKNRLPFPGYWQQDVYYKIKADIDEQTDIIDGTLELTYWNNSPDELTFVFFHLYSNAFTPGSYLHELTLANGVKPKFGKYEKEGLALLVESMRSSGNDLKTEFDNTILKVWLPEPLKTGQSVKFNIGFKSYFDTGEIRRRMKTFKSSGHKHYDGVHWYPRISVYDSKFGWDTDQHLNHEYYGNFGTFDAELTFASQFVVEATGTLQNENEVMPDSLRKKLDIRNFADKPFGSPASVIIPPDGKRKTWKYYAENVHDFVFTADPTYRIGEANWNGIRCISLAQESNASKWQNAAEYTSKIIKTFSEDIGMYAWPKIIVADARDGMEYPMITLDGGTDPGYRGLFVHEVGHMWFFGMVGNNETYRPILDEGFTQFLTAWGLDKIDGPYPVTQPSKSSYINRYTVQQTNRYRSVYYAYLLDALKFSAPAINTHSDHFHGALGHGGGYRHVYYKTATMLYNLEYVLGEELFLKSMQHYFNQWKMCHPYPEDFRNSIIRFTKVDLNWFFDQWIETDKSIDYSIQKVKRLKDDQYEITFARKQRMQMPIDFSVYDKNGRKYDFYIPNTWFEKKTDAKILPRWTGWDKLNPTYSAVVTIPNGLEKVVIDTSLRLADIDMRDNFSKIPVSFTFDSHVSSLPIWTKYELKGRPDIWWNAYDGVKTGVHLKGSYMNYRDVFSLSAWFNSGLAQKNFEDPVRVNEYDDFSFILSYRDGIDRYIKGATVHAMAKSLDGLKASMIGISKQFDNKNKIEISVKTMFREEPTDFLYLLYPDEWSFSQYNNMLNLNWEQFYQHSNGSSTIKFGTKTSVLSADFDFTFISLEVVNKGWFGKLDLSTRQFIQYGYGNKFAQESMLFLSGANSEQLMDNKFTRSAGFVPDEWVTPYGAETNHFHMGGGLNLRGYSGYLVAEEVSNGEVRYVYKGTSGASFSVELEFDRLVKFKPKPFKKWLKLDTYLFGDAGVINENKSGVKLAFSSIRADAGVGTTLTIKRWGPLQTIKPLTLRVDFPLFLNRTPAADPEHFQFRYVVGLNKSF
jgi:hypothetical protein